MADNPSPPDADDGDSLPAKPRRYRPGRWLAILLAVLVLAGAFVWRVATSREVIDSVPLSTGQFNIRFLKADVGTLNYSSDDRLRAFLRPRLPANLVRKLGDVTTVNATWHQELGGPPLLLMFQLLTPQNQMQTETTNVFGRIEFPESTGFTFVNEIRGYNSHRRGTSIHDFTAFPRRDRTLTFRLHEENGRLLMEKSLPNPEYRTDFPVWAPDPLPQLKAVDGLRVTLNSLRIDPRLRLIQPQFEVASDDASWLPPQSSRRWSDATGNVGEWLSPFEPAWKLHLRLLRRPNAEFPAAAVWKSDLMAIPEGLTLTPVDGERVVDGIGLRIRYVAPASEVRDEGGIITINPPRSPGQVNLSTSAGSTGGATGQRVTYHAIESGVPFIRLDHDPFPPGVELLCDVRDQQGVLINKDLRPGQGGVNNTPFHAVYYKPNPDSRSVQLELRINRPRDLEFLVAPPAELREAAQQKTPAR